MRALLPALSLLLAASPATAAAKPPKLTPFIAYDAGGACTGKGISLSVSGALPEGTRKAKARAIKRKYAPNGKATLTVAGMTLLVAPLHKADYVSELNVGWGFKVLEVSRAV